MSFILQNIEKKLKKSVINKPISFIELNPYGVVKTSFIVNKNIHVSFVIKKLLFNFLIFLSKKLRQKKKNVKNLMLFLKFYRYYTSYFFNNKIFFFKKYFLKKNVNIFYFNSFFLSAKQVRLKPCLHRLKEKRIAFYKKNI